MHPSPQARKLIGFTMVMAALALAILIIPLAHAAAPSEVASSSQLVPPTIMRTPPSPAAASNVVTPNADVGAWCITPCKPPLVWRGGKVYHTPHVFLIFWGPLWEDTTAPKYSDYYKVEMRMQGLFSHLAGSSYNAILSQYHDATGFIVNSVKDPVLQANVRLTGTPKSDLTPGDEAAAIQTEIEKNPAWTSIDDAIYFLMPQDGSTYQNFTQEKGCAFHSVTQTTDRVFAVIPYLGDTKFQNCLVYGAGKDYINAMTVTASHEYAETVTDPFPLPGKVGWKDEEEANEIADLCASREAVVSALGADVSLLFDNRSWDANHSNGCDDALYTPPHVSKVVFSGYDPQGRQQLWLTDGTSSGSHLVSGIAGINPTYGLEPGDMVSIGSKAVFSGYDAKNHFQVWATNGTAAGTQELTTITNTVGAGRGGVDPFNFTPFASGKALFTGYDAKGNNGLWITNGTPLGTFEVTTGNVNPGTITNWGSEAYFYGYLPQGGNAVLWKTNGTTSGTQALPNSPISLSNFAVFGTHALFTADTDGLGDYGVWITDGTAAGTHRVQDPYKPGFALGPVEYTVIGSKAVFNAFDSDSRQELWATDGTAGGTVELTTGPGGPVGQGIDPGYIAAYGSQAVFNAYDDKGNSGLWITNGIGTGTHEVSAQAVAPYAFKRFGSQMLFSAIDATYGRCLWITNGTLTGTKRLGNFSSLQPTGITVFGNKAVFNGLQSSLYPQLWSADGTPADTKDLTTTYSVYPNNFAVIG